MDQNATMGTAAEAGVRAQTPATVGLKFHNVYKFEARDAAGRIKWTEETPNITVNEGLNDILSKYFKGSSYTAAFYVGLINNASFSALAAGDTAAQIGGSNGWLEATAYSESVRQTLTLGSVSAQSVDNSASKATFSINGAITIKGAFVVTNSTKSGTSGLIYGEAAFGSTRLLANGDTLTVTVTLTAATA